jgi:beta-lactamase superfamily II metal-dependent hydrolase
MIDQKKPRLLEEPRTYLAMIEATNVADIQYGKPVLSIVIDGIYEEKKEYGLIHFVTTAQKMVQCLALEEPLNEGDWIVIEVTNEEKPIAASILNLGQEIEQTPFEEEGYISSITKLNDEPRAKSLSSAATKSIPTEKEVQDKHDLGNLAQMEKDKEERFTGWCGCHSIPQKGTVYDVGQGSFSAIEFSCGSTLFFDVGQPLWFQWEKKLNERIQDLPKPEAPNCDFIVLSHWDWDHYARGRFSKEFHEVSWVAPIQIVSPSAYKLAETLWKKGRLFLLSPSSYAFELRNSVRLFSCPRSAKNKKEKNNTGIFMEVWFENGHTSLLTGDCDYDVIRKVKGKSDLMYSSVVVPHHGGKLLSKPPRVIPKGRGFIFSYGTTNTYGHPHISTLKKHSKALIGSTSRNTQMRGTAYNQHGKHRYLTKTSRGSLPM